MAHSGTRNVARPAALNYVILEKIRLQRLTE